MTTTCQNCLQLEVQIATLKKELQSKQELIAKMDERLSVDALTGIKNRHFLQYIAPGIVNRRKKVYETWGVLMLDIDHFKNFNDRYGHPFGDLVLKNVAQMLQSVSRYDDIVVRYGGEEFCIIISGVSAEELQVVAERYRKAIEALKNICKMTQTEASVTVSVGACFVSSESDITLSEIIEYADQALYRAKDNGRNCLVVSNRRAHRRI